MCTVSFLPLNDKDFIFTSNRDIPYSRPKASSPSRVVENGVSLTYPKDGKAGGTWIGTSEHQRLLCLLNGGFVNHKSLDTYARSRGLVVKELLGTADLKKGVEQIDLDGIEPFTMVMVDWQTQLKLYEFVWDGVKKHFKLLDLSPRIWSSSTLYSPEVKQLREQWFQSWLAQAKKEVDQILEFHQTAGVGDPEIDVMMDRGKGGTVSVSCIEKKNSTLRFLYKDVTNGTVDQLIYKA